MANTHTPPSVSANEESICSSLDENMPLLHSILRGEEVQLYDDTHNNDGDGGRQSLIESDVNGYQIPFASDIRVVADGNQTTTSSEKAMGGTKKVILIKGFNRDLIGSVFRKKHIYFVGDSTLRNLFVALRRLLNYMQYGVPEKNQNETDSSSKFNSRTLPPGKYDGLDYDKWTGSLEFLFEKAQKKWHRGDSLPPFMIPADRTYIRILEVNSLYWELPEAVKSDKKKKKKTSLREEFIKLAKETLLNSDVVIFNAGMRLLHLIPKRILSHYQYEAWSQYESILEKLLHVSTESQAPVILAKSSNRICNSKMGPDYRKYARWYAESNKTILTACQRLIRKQQETDKKQAAHRKGHTITMLSESQLDEICKYGALNDHGSLLLNQRMSKFVERMRTTTMPGDRLRYFNDHDVESCNFTGDEDGRHYEQQVFVRLHLLAIMIDCMS